MKIRYLGEVVRQRRKTLGVSQELVCEGLCTAMTLSRFESGRQTPSWDCVVAILQRLGLPDSRYYAQLTRAETRLLLLRKEVSAYCGQFEQFLGEEKQQAHMNALNKLYDLERCIKEDDHINQQFILGMRATLEPHPPQKQLEMLMEAIRLTSPRFDPDEISSCLYSTDEVALINKIAIRHFRCGQRGKAIDIYRQLLELIQRRTPDHGYLSLIAYNYARYLLQEKQYKESVEIAEFGRQTCVQQEHYCLLPGFLHIEAACWFFMGKIDLSTELYRSAYYLYEATENKRDLETLKNEARENVNLIV